MYIQHSFEVPMLRIHVPSFAMLKVEQPPNVEKCSLQTERPRKQYSVWFFLQPTKSSQNPSAKTHRLLLYREGGTPKNKNKTQKTYRVPSHQPVSHEFVWTKSNVRSLTLQADKDVVCLHLHRNPVKSSL